MPSIAAAREQIPATLPTAWHEQAIRSTSLTQITKLPGDGCSLQHVMLAPPAHATYSAHATDLLHSACSSTGPQHVKCMQTTAKAVVFDHTCVPRNVLLLWCNISKYERRFVLRLGLLLLWCGLLIVLRFGLCTFLL